MTMNARAVVAAVSLVLLGVVLGATGHYLWLGHRRPTVVVDASHAARFHALLEDLDLSDDQRRSLDSVLGHFQEHVERTWQDFQPDLAETMDSATGQIEALLNPEQLARFRAWIEAEHQLQHGTHPRLH